MNGHARNYLGWVITLVLCNSIGAAQKADSTSLLGIPPVPPFLLKFHYWPEQCIQWVGKELPYRMIEAYVDRTKEKAAYDIVLTRRGSFKRTHFANQQSLVDAARQSGEEAYLAPITLKVSDDVSTGPTYEFSFTNREGKPVFWRFIQGSDVSEEGSGVTPYPESPAVVLIYREAGAIAAKGTALQIGNTVNEAAYWRSISAPPYFVAYQGARTEGLDIGEFQAGDVKWKISGLPTALASGQTWKLTDEAAHDYAIQISKIESNQYTFTAINSEEPSSTEQIVAHSSPQGWTIRRIQFHANQKNQRGLVVEFQPELPVSSAAASNSEIKFEVQAGKKVIASGLITIKQNANQKQYVWRWKVPTWAQNRILTEALDSGPGTIHLQAAIATVNQPAK